MFSKRIREAFENFSRYTTLHGINRIVSSKHVVGKLLWTCIVLTCIAVCFMQIYKLGVQYGSKQVNTKVSIRYQKVYFPAVSFCNLNPVSYSKMKQKADDGDYLANHLVGIHRKIRTKIDNQFKKASTSKGNRGKTDITRATTNNHGPLNTTIQKSNYKVLYGETVTLKCDVAGISIPFVVQWLKKEGPKTRIVTSENTYKYKYNHNYNIDSEISTASLTIFNTDQNDSGVYICTTRNITGNDTIQTVILLEVSGLALDIDPILSASEEFRLAMSMKDFGDDYINYTERTIREMSADFSDLLLHCNFEGRPCNESVFVPFFDNYYGQCYRFPTEKIITRRAGPLFALKMLINVNQSDYVPYVASEAGIRLVIHEHGSQSYLENSGISVATGFRTDISLIQKRIERIPGSTECDPRNKFKNINACFEECIDRNVKKKCGCLLTFSRATSRPKLYTCYKDKEFDCIEGVRENVTGCKCKNPCSEKRHEMTITTTRWPAENYEELLEQILENKGLSVSNIKDSLMQMDVFFSSLYEEVTEEVPSFTFENFLSNIGGTLGLWIGMSVISIGELVELGFLLLKSMARQKKVIETQTTVNEEKAAEPAKGSKKQFVYLDMNPIDEGNRHK